MDISLVAQNIFESGNIQISNTFLLSLIIGAFLVWFLGFAAGKPKIIPSKTQGFVETLFEGILGFMDTITLSREKTEKFFPLVGSLFVFILSANLSEIMPGVGSIKLGEAELFRTPSTDLNFTIALALVSMVAVHLMSIRELGLMNYGKKFFNFSSPIKLFVGVVEAISEFGKVLSLSLRLFGSMFCGGVILLLATALFAYFLPVPLLIFEMIIGFIQAFVFSVLITVFLSLMTVKEEH